MDHLAVMRGRAECHQHSNGWKKHVACIMSPSDAVYIEKSRGPRMDP